MSAVDPLEILRLRFADALKAKFHDTASDDLWIGHTPPFMTCFMCATILDAIWPIVVSSVDPNACW